MLGREFDEGRSNAQRVISLCIGALLGRPADRGYCTHERRKRGILEQRAAINVHGVIPSVGSRKQGRGSIGRPPTTLRHRRSGGRGRRAACKSPPAPHAACSTGHNVAAYLHERSRNPVPAASGPWSKRLPPP